MARTGPIVADIVFRCDKHDVDLLGEPMLSPTIVLEKVVLQYELDTSEMFCPRDDDGTASCSESWGAYLQS